MRLKNASFEHVAVASAVRADRSRLVCNATARLPDQKESACSHPVGWVVEAVTAEVVAFACVDAAAEVGSVRVCVGGRGGRAICYWGGGGEEEVQQESEEGKGSHVERLLEAFPFCDSLIVLPWRIERTRGTVSAMVKSPRLSESGMSRFVI
jgi:hypothetical protein